MDCSILIMQEMDVRYREIGDVSFKSRYPAQNSISPMKSLGLLVDPSFVFEDSALGRL